jgi:hypothetical protein
MTRRPSQEEYDTVKRASDMLIDVAIFWPIDEYLTDLIRAYSRTIRVWAGRCGCVDQQRVAEVLDRLLHQHLTILDAIGIMRKLIRRLEPIAQYTPPSFQLARHYLESIVEKYEKGEPINIYEERKMKEERDTKRKK